MRRRKEVKSAQKMIGTIFTIIGASFLAVDLIVMIPMWIYTRASVATLICGSVFGIIGPVFLCIGIAFLAANKREKKKIAELKATGERVYATVVDAAMDHSLSINGRHPYRLDCRYEDPFSGEVYLYRSGYVWSYPEIYLHQEIPVYVDRQNRGRYYVAVEALADRLEADASLKVHDYR